MSVYTHLSRATVDHYLGETSRVLRPGGMCLNTFFVHGRLPRSRPCSPGRADRSLRETGRRRLRRPTWTTPTSASGSRLMSSTRSMRATVLTIVPPIRFGGWTGRKLESFVYQDVVVAREGNREHRAQRAGGGAQIAVADAVLAPADQTTDRVDGIFGGCPVAQVRGDSFRSLSRVSPRRSKLSPPLTRSSWSMTEAPTGVGAVIADAASHDDRNPRHQAHAQLRSAQRHSSSGSGRLDIR